MKLQPYIDKLSSSAEFKKFQKKYKDSFLVAGFFILDFETDQNMYQIDYYISSEKKVAAFTIGDTITLQILETLNEKTPERLDARNNIDLEAIKGILEDGMKNRNITEEIRKVIAVIQNIKGKRLWVLNCILSGMEILKAHVDDESGTVLMMERASVLDYIKKLPMGIPASEKAPTKEDIDEQLKQLDKVREVLQKEKEEIDGKADKKSPAGINSVSKKLANK